MKSKKLENRFNLGHLGNMNYLGNTPPGKLVPFTSELILPELEIIESVCKLRVCELFYFNSLRTTGKFTIKAIWADFS